MWGKQSLDCLANYDVYNKGLTSYKTIKQDTSSVANSLTWYNNTSEDLANKQDMLEKHIHLDLEIPNKTSPNFDFIIEIPEKTRLKLYLMYKYRTKHA